MIKTPFWYKKFSILYEKDYLFEFCPSRRFDINRKLNSIVRLSILYSLIMYLIQKNNKYLIIPFITAILSWIIWNKYKDTHIETIVEESMSNQLDDLVKINDLETECRVPTKENPFMNPLLDEFSNSKLTKPKSCPSYNNIGVQHRIEELFEEELYRDVKDVFKKNNSQRQFYSVPGNQVPNDQESFAQWCYGMPKTCKEGNQIACLSGMGRAGGSGGTIG
tara:strand:+ start:4740 stop:5402 length:663 start_codon:yes stop_codon:yes gene_type:complete